MSIKLLAMQSFDEIWEIFKTQFPLAIWETLYTTVLATALATIIGLPLGVLLVAGENGRILRVPAFVLRCISAIINLLRSVPFLILMVVVIPFTRLIVGTYVGTLASVVPLVIAAFPFIARLAESSLREVNPNVIEAAQSMGASPMQIIIKVMIPESIPSPYIQRHHCRNHDSWLYRNERRIGRRRTGQDSHKLRLLQISVFRYDPCRSVPYTACGAFSDAGNTFGCTVR